MKLFIREHVPLIGFTLIQLCLVLLVVWFDGYQQIGTALYAMFLGLFVLLGYLIYRYVTHRKLYERLSRPLASIHDGGITADTPLGHAIDSLLEKQYGYYQQQLKTWERKQQEHLTFMNQWVHQMKTPLSVIELIIQDGEDIDPTSISEETDRLRQGLEMVLYMSRLETFAQDFHVDRVSLHAVVKEAIKDNKGFFIRSYVYPENVVPEELFVETDVKWLRFVIYQLLSNAIKYSAGSREKVTISAYTEGRSVFLEVIDRGAGIPKQDVSRVFRAFYTGENGRAYRESTGMGLYLVKEVVDKLHHNISLESTVGAGTTVRIEFPYAGTRAD
ncbi:sensor histidine kinase [Paenibacillus assamensis]|uniref:sensor histidine kinase n=1 Tax=Paenibacillus assamensis TaxID=311244 RepID=UPI0003F5E4F1|nr:sensor histidine kinase [Paenibacillus assamensis]